LPTSTKSTRRRTSSNRWYEAFLWAHLRFGQRLARLLQLRNSAADGDPRL
jgi:hypothetical protein